MPGSKKTKKTISVIVHKLPHREFISSTVLINSKKSSAINYGCYGLNLFENKKDLSVIIFGGMVWVAAL